MSRPTMPLVQMEHLFIDITTDSWPLRAIAAYLRAAVQLNSGERVIIFRNSGPKAIKLALSLRALGFCMAAPLVGKQSEAERQKIISLFNFPGGPIQILVVTPEVMANYKNGSSAAFIPVNADHVLLHSFKWSSGASNTRDYVGAGNSCLSRIVSLVSIADSVTLQHLQSSLGIRLREIQLPDDILQEAQKDVEGIDAKPGKLLKEESALKELLAGTPGASSAAAASSSPISSPVDSRPDPHSLGLPAGLAAMMDNINTTKQQYVSLFGDNNNSSCSSKSGAIDGINSSSSSDNDDDDDDGYNSPPIPPPRLPKNSSSNDQKLPLPRNMSPIRLARKNGQQDSAGGAAAASGGSVGFVLPRGGGGGGGESGVLSRGRQQSRSRSGSCGKRSKSNGRSSSSGGGGGGGCSRKPASDVLDHAFAPNYQAGSRGSKVTQQAQKMAGVSSPSLMLNRARSGGGGAGGHNNNNMPQQKANMNRIMNKPPFQPHPGDEQLVEQIESEMRIDGGGVGFDDIAGQEEAKTALQEAVVLPALMPNFFADPCRRPSKGVLLYGPPGTGKTLLAKAAATEGHTTFFSVSPATLTSKWRGESEKLIRVLFEMARWYAPSTIFIDEVDSLCSERGGGGENEASRRAKGTLLAEIDGFNSSCGSGGGHVVFVGATNHPASLDEAFRRRFQSRIYVPLPSLSDRVAIFKLHTKSSSSSSHPLVLASDVNFGTLSRNLEGKFFSGADIANVARDAVLRPMRRWIAAGDDGAEPSTADRMRRMKQLQDPNLAAQFEEKLSKIPVQMKDFVEAISSVGSSINASQIKRHEEWRAQFGIAAAG